MTLTRLAFFKLLGAVGIGQVTRTQPTQPSGQVKSGECLQKADVQGHLIFGPCGSHMCEEGKEDCPLGHCQKPKRINGTTSSLTIYAADDGIALGQVELHVCSVCGMVYVPSEGQAKP